MRFFFKYLYLLILIFFSQVAKSSHIDDSYSGTWGGIEVIGADLAMANKIRMNMPFRIGDTFYLSDLDAYFSKCKKLLKETIDKETNCSIGIYGSGKVYLCVDILPIEANNKLFRSIPNKNSKIAHLSQDFLNLYNQLEKRDSSLKSKGIFPREKYDQGFKDYEDPILHELAVKLSKYAFKYNKSLLDILHYSPDPEERRQAATFLAWSKHPENIKLLIEWNIMMDPDRTVRNNVDRSVAFLLGDIKDKKLVKELIQVYCMQMNLPSHTDRNKALVSMRKILQNNPEHASSICSECKKRITYISEVSILENVGGIAKAILKIIDDASNV